MVLEYLLIWCECVPGLAQMWSLAVDYCPSTMVLLRHVWSTYLRMPQALSLHQVCTPDNFFCCLCILSSSSRAKCGTNMVNSRLSVWWTLYKIEPDIADHCRPSSLVLQHFSEIWEWNITSVFLTVFPRWYRVHSFTRALHVDITWAVTMIPIVMDLVWVDQTLTIVCSL